MRRGQYSQETGFSAPFHFHPLPCKQSHEAEGCRAEQSRYRPRDDQRWQGLECCPQGLVLFFPDAEEILGVWENLLMFIEAAVGGIGHRIEAGPKVGIQKKKKTDEGRTRGCGCSDRTGLHRKPEDLTGQVQR